MRLELATFGLADWNTWHLGLLQKVKAKDKNNKLITLVRSGVLSMLAGLAQLLLILTLGQK